MFTSLYLFLFSFVCLLPFSLPPSFLPFLPPSFFPSSFLFRSFFFPFLFFTDLIKRSKGRVNRLWFVKIGSRVENMCIDVRLCTDLHSVVSKTNIIKGSFRLLRRSNKHVLKNRQLRIKFVVRPWLTYLVRDAPRRREVVRPHTRSYTKLKTRKRNRLRSSCRVGSTRPGLTHIKPPTSSRRKTTRPWRRKRNQESNLWRTIKKKKKNSPPPPTFFTKRFSGYTSSSPYSSLSPPETVPNWDWKNLTWVRIIRDGSRLTS